MATGAITSFIDDDVYCTPTWVENVIKVFRHKEVVGVTGPTEITEEYKKNRDLFKYKRLKRIYDRLFLDNKAAWPSYLSEVGSPSTASNDAGTSYEGHVSFLEACNMSVRTDPACMVGGFGNEYVGTSEWCEVDLALKLGQRGILWYTDGAKLYHRPSQAGVYVDRLKTRHRWDNFVTFQSKWIRPSLRRHLYWFWIWTYLTLKQLRLI